MFFDLPASVENEVQQYALDQRISPTEAAVKLIQDGLKAKRRKADKRNLVTDEQIRQLKALNSSFGLLEDVPEEKIDRMLATIKRMKREGFPARDCCAAGQHSLYRFRKGTQTSAANLGSKFDRERFGLQPAEWKAVLEHRDRSRNS